MERVSASSACWKEVNADVAAVITPRNGDVVVDFDGTRIEEVEEEDDDADDAAVTAATAAATAGVMLGDGGTDGMLKGRARSLMFCM